MSEEKLEKKRKREVKILPALLTAGKSVQIWTNDQKIGLKYSIDRITLMADLSLEAWEKHFFKWLQNGGFYLYFFYEKNKFMGGILRPPP